MIEAGNDAIDDDDDLDDCQEVRNISSTFIYLAGMLPEQAWAQARSLHRSFLAMMEEKTAEERRHIRREMWQVGVDAGHTDAQEDYEEFDELQDGERRHLCGCPFQEAPVAAPADESETTQERPPDVRRKPDDIPPDRGRLH